MSTVSALLNHIQADDEQSEAAVGAFVDFFEQSTPRPAPGPLSMSGPTSVRSQAVERHGLAFAGDRRTDSESLRQWDEAIEAVAQFLHEEPDHPSLVFALGKSHDPSIQPLLEELVARFLGDRTREELVWQSLVARLNFDDLPREFLARVANEGPSIRVRRLARRRLDILDQLG